MIPCQQLRIRPDRIVGRSHLIGYQQSDTRRNRVANWAEFRRAARKNGCTCAQMATWLALQGVELAQGILLIRYVIRCSSSEAEAALKAAGVNA